VWISNYAISNRVVTTVVMLALAVFGILALFVLERDEFPEIDPPVIAVSLPYPGASPQGVEREVVDPLEEAFASISGVRRIWSTSMDSFGLIIIEFEFQKNLQEASQDIRDAVSKSRRDLPREMEEPILRRFDPNDLPIVSLTLSAPGLSSAELTLLADPGITSELRSLAGVAEVKVVGGVNRQLNVELSPAALEQMGVSPSEVVQAVQAQNLAAPVGRVNARFEERTIRLKGRFESPQEFEGLVVTARSGRTIRLGEVARVVDASEEPRSLALRNDTPAVGIDVIKSSGYSTTEVSRSVRAKIAEIARRLPGDVELEMVRDAGVRVERSVASVQSALVEGAVLTVAVVFLFLASWRSTVITGLALPISVLASFVAVWAFGFTLNTMSLLGLSLAIGILIDDAIVVRENIVRHMAMGKGHLAAAREGTSEIGLAVSATTFSIVVVFIPVAFMGGVAQQWFAPFALTIASSVLVSLLVAFSLDPMLSASWADPDALGRTRGRFARKLAAFSDWFERRTSLYKKTIAWALRHPVIMFVIGTAAFIGALAMPFFGVVGSELFPQEDRSEIDIAVQTPPGSSLEYTRRKLHQAVSLIRAHSEVAYTYATVGGESEAVDEATVYVRLVPRNQRRLHQNELSTALRRELAQIGGMEASIGGSAFGGRKQIQIEITGPDLTRLGELADRAAQLVREVPGVADVSLSSKGEKPEYVVDVDRGLAGSLGVSASDIALSLRVAFAGVDAGDWVDPTGETRDVQVRLAPERRAGRASLEALPVLTRGAEGQRPVSLAHVARITESTGPVQIDRVGRRRVVRVEANTENRPLNQVVQDIDVALRELAMPEGYAINQGGETEDQREIFGRMLLALAVAVLLMYFVLVIQFRSFMDPIPVMASLPLSLIGVMLGLLVTGSTLNIMSMIGIVLLVGIVAKNAILLLDFAKWMQAEGKDRHSAIIEAGGVRLRPIVMTTLAIMAGMTPVAIGMGEGADFRAPLGRAVIGGVLTSTLLTLLVIPTFYDVLASGRDAIKRRFFG
jgi:hydrophobe/amphiphile efflux-1 (HAE1) family protein